MRNADFSQSAWCEQRLRRGRRRCLHLAFACPLARDWLKIDGPRTCTHASPNCALGLNGIAKNGGTQVVSLAVSPRTDSSIKSKCQSTLGQSALNYDFHNQILFSASKVYFYFHHSFKLDSSAFQLRVFTKIWNWAHLLAM